MVDRVNPSHYKESLVIPKDRLESHLDSEGNLSLDVASQMEYRRNLDFPSYLIGSAIKYLERLGKKNDVDEDFSKALWFSIRTYKAKKGLKDSEVSSDLVKKILKLVNGQE